MAKILVACESSGTVRDAFTALGHDATSADLLPSESPGKHYQGDVLDIIDDPWDMIIAHPPCTYLTISQAWTFHRPDRFPDRLQQRGDAIRFAERLFFAKNCQRVVLENPVGFLSTLSRIGKYPYQTIQPYQFGHDASKRTILWLRGVEPLRIDPTAYFEPRIVHGRPRWGNQTDSGQNRLPPTADRWKKRSLTYSGIARAMADQWGKVAQEKVNKRPPGPRQLELF